MATLGAFQMQDDGAIKGALKTLTLDLRTVVLRPAEKTNDQAPDFRIFAGAIECGAAWKKTSRDHRPYISVKLDDPSFAAPMYASLVESDQGYSLIWSRARTLD